MIRNRCKLETQFDHVCQLEIVVREAQDEASKHSQAVTQDKVEALAADAEELKQVEKRARSEAAEFA